MNGVVNREHKLNKFIPVDSSEDNRLEIALTFSDNVHSEEIHEIITAVPSWIIRCGITLIFVILIGILLMSALISYPDVIKTGLKVNSLNSPKPVVAKMNAKLTALLAQDGDAVKENQILAYIESTGKPQDILEINTRLIKIKADVLQNINSAIELPTGLNLGEFQSSYQNFYQQYLAYKATQKNGYYLERIAFLERDFKDINSLRRQITSQQKIQEKEYANNEKEYQAYKQLYDKKVISRSEFSQQENKYLASKYPLEQSQTAILNNSSALTAKQKELFDIRNTVAQEQARFIQALNQCIGDSEAWIQLHVLRAPIAGKLSYAGIVQQNQNVLAGQEIFMVNPGNSDFFGEVEIPQYNMGKIQKGEKTLVKLRSYPFEQYGTIRGRLTYVSDAAYRDSVFIAKVSFETFENKEKGHKIILKNGMLADAEIITEESSLLQRFFRNITKMMNSQR